MRCQTPASVRDGQTEEAQNERKGGRRDTISAQHVVAARTQGHRRQAGRGEGDQAGPDTESAGRIKPVAPNSSASLHSDRC